MQDSNKLVYVIDQQGKFTYVNEAFCRLSGFTSEALLGRRYDSLKHQDMPTAVYQDLWQWISQGLSWQGVIKNNSQDGKAYSLDTFITPQYCDGRIVGYQCICHPAEADLAARADKIYQAMNRGDKWATFEFTRWHKFLFLTFVTLVAQALIFTYGGFIMSMIAAMAAVTPIIVFWQDIVPMAIRAQTMQSSYDTVSSRLIYSGKGTASVFDFNLAMLKTKIKAILERTSDATVPLTRIVDQVQTGMSSSRNIIERQRNEMLQISDAITQMSAASNEIAENTVSTAQDVNATSEQCEQARSNIAQTTANIKSLATEVDEAAASADSLSHEAQNIETLMTDIQSIADQTNLLALNAAIEAARAGENGRGFAVVADEVRNLSFRTQESSKQIQGSLTAMLKTISDWVELMEHNKDQAVACVDAAEQSDQAIEQVYQRIQQIANLAAQIATAAEEQGAVTTDINNNMQTVSEASEQNWQQTEQVHEQMDLLHQSVTDIANLSDTFMPKK